LRPYWSAEVRRIKIKEPLNLKSILESERWSGVTTAGSHRPEEEALYQQQSKACVALEVAKGQE